VAFLTGTAFFAGALARGGDAFAGAVFLATLRFAGGTDRAAAFFTAGFWGLEVRCRAGVGFREGMEPIKTQPSARWQAPAADPCEFPARS